MIEINYNLFKMRKCKSCITSKEADLKREKLEKLRLRRERGQEERKNYEEQNNLEITSLVEDELNIGEKPRMKRREKRSSKKVWVSNESKDMPEELKDWDMRCGGKCKKRQCVDSAQSQPVPHEPGTTKKKSKS